MKKLLHSAQSLQISSAPKEKLVYPPRRGDRDIRLVQILPGSQYSSVKCELTVASLDLPPEYVVLSYRWGDATQNTWITYNGQRLDVTSNLINALRAFRQRDKAVTFSIDQICINQENVPERSNQVRLMRDIYTRAKSVSIWLGKEADNSNMAITFMKRVVPILERLGHTVTEKDLQDSGLPPTQQGKE